MPKTLPCLECGGYADSGEPVTGGFVCEGCWQVHLRTATSHLCDRITERIDPQYRIDPVSVSRIVASALPDRADRLRVWFELSIRGLGPNRASGKRSPHLIALVDELRDSGLPQKMIGQRHLPGSAGSRGICAQCGKERQYTGRIGGALLCSGCWRSHEQVLKACVRCEQIDYLRKDRLCKGCRRRDEVKALFTPEQLAKRPALENVRDILLGADARYLDKMVGSGRNWRILCQLLASEADISHEGLDATGRPGAGMLRSFLVATGVLPERNERLHAFEQWILRTSQTITDDRDRRSFTGFARWRHLRKARGQDRTEAQFAGQRRELAQVRALLHILHAQGLTVNSVEQATMDGWLAGGPAERHRVKAFLEWCRTNGTGKTLKILPPPASGLPTVFLTPEHERAMLLGQILDPQKNIEPGLRLAAGLVIIYGFRSHEIRGLSLADITFTNETVWIRFGHEPLRLPEELGEYARQAAGRRRVMRFGGNAEDMQWLFPGPLHGHPIGAPALRKRLAVIGIRPHAARATALGQLAQQLPPPILARLTGLAPSTTVRWNAAVAASYGRNLPSNAP
jgi:integrase